ncbi:IS200/IS605 family accessory protein TnpB-related protein [Streptomyces caniscabiei]|nr:IS200/IS605 family accessory protein TnpB-related protein [Streptomyces caniscabiei]MDX2735565.1 IS200/IS605 family accessory protein TnpB-related protein [Streptomyces caniscabiei]MDX2777032.1 IS200/IS605 family accessory protein TnpB-related protein [Streptomyces caniscabiei]
MRSIAAPFVASGPAGVAVRTRLKQLTPGDETVLRLVGAHLGSLASRDLKARCRDGREHSAKAWAVRKRELTPASSSRWAGSITKATHEQWALARRCQLAHIQNLEAGIRTIEARLALPVGQKGTKRAPGGYRSRREWHAKARRLRVLQDRLAAARADREAGIVHVVRGGKRLARARHHLEAAGLTESAWRGRWEAERWFCQADGESGKRHGNETIRISPDGEVSIKLPTPLAHLANAPRGRYVLTGRVAFAHRGTEWADRVVADRVIAYRILPHSRLRSSGGTPIDTGRGRWYLTASWQIPPTPTVPIEAALAHGVIGVDMNADHLAAWRLDTHGNPTGSPRRFFYNLTCTAQHRDAQVRHALTRLLHWARTCGVKAIAVEDLDFTAEKTREKHGRRTRFRQLISGMPTSRLRARLASMADATGITVIAVDPAYTSRWGAQHGQKPLTTTTRKTTRHEAAAVAIGRRAQQHPVRRRTAPPPHDRSDRAGHRTVQARPGVAGREEPRPRIPGPRTRSVPPGRGANAGNQNAQHRPGRSTEHETWQQDSLPPSP